MPELDVKLGVDAKAVLGECPFWDPVERKLFWVDIVRGLVHVHDPEGTPDITYSVGCKVGAIAPCRGERLVIAGLHGFEFFDLRTKSRKPIADPENHRTTNRFNDGCCSPEGRFWAGTQSMVKHKGAASLYVLDHDLSTRRALKGVTTSNGLAWSGDGKTMYYIDTPTLRVDAFDYHPKKGTIAVKSRRTVVSFAEVEIADFGRPDGMTCDSEDKLWIAHWEGGRVTRWDPENGKLLQTIRLPVDRVTSVAFGGDDLDRLYITTARTGLPQERLERQPLAGGLFVAEPGVTGRPVAVFDFQQKQET
jgi:sugar lactone lactonase YvrE